MYSPTLGRFLQTDPIGYDDQFNLYAYVGNDPVNGVDPTGKQAVEIIKCALSFVCRAIVKAAVKKVENAATEAAQGVSEVTGAMQDFVENNSEMRDEWRKGVTKAITAKQIAMHHHGGLRESKPLNCFQIFGKSMGR